MRVLLVDVTEPLLTPLRRRLADHHEVTVLDTTDDRLLDPATRVAAGHDAVVHDIAHAHDDTGLLRATLGTWSLLRDDAGPRRYVQLSSMDQFVGYHPGWRITEEWAPRPGTDVTALATHLGELTSRELSRTRSGQTAVLRLAEVADTERFDAHRFAASRTEDRLHADDAVAAVVTAVEVDDLRVGAVDPRVPVGGAAGWWRVAHVVPDGGRHRMSAGAIELLGRPDHRLPPDSAAAESTTPDASGPPTWPVEPGPIRLDGPATRITLFGAGGPLAAATARLLRERPVLLTDREPLADVAARPPQSPYAPQPDVVGPPHTERVVDVTDRDQVLDAARGADCLVNAAVHRADEATAFRVNLLGAVHVMRVAADLGIRRVVHTGPAMTIAPYPDGHAHDRAVDGRGSFRPGRWVYTLSKFLALEACRLLADRHRIACPILLFTAFADPVHGDTLARGPGRQLGPYAISWDDAARAMVAAIDVPALDRPAPVLDILHPGPHDRFSAEAAQRTLGWHPQDRLDHFWWRHSAG